jgi:hypothetical protein
LRAVKIGSLKVTNTELADFLVRNQGKDLSDVNNIRDLHPEC